MSEVRFQIKASCSELFVLMEQGGSLEQHEQAKVLHWELLWPLGELWVSVFWGKCLTLGLCDIKQGNMGGAVCTTED